MDSAVPFAFAKDAGAGPASCTVVTTVDPESESTATPIPAATPPPRRAATRSVAAFAHVEVIASRYSPGRLKSRLRRVKPGLREQLVFLLGRRGSLRLVGRRFLGLHCPAVGHGGAGPLRRGLPPPPPP